MQAFAIPVGMLLKDKFLGHRQRVSNIPPVPRPYIHVFSILQLEANRYKAKKLQEHINSVSDWTTSTTVFVDEFNEIAPQLLQTDDTPEKDEKDDATTDETGAKDGAVDEGDEEKAKQEREEKISKANEVIHRIAVSFNQVQMKWNVYFLNGKILFLVKRY